MRFSSVTPLGDLVVVADHRDAEAVAVVVDEVALTAGDLLERVVDRARQLRGAGVRPGSRVAIAMPNGLAWIESFFALQMLGAVVVPVNLRYHPKELDRLVAHAGITVVLADGDGIDLATEVSGRVRVVTEMDGPRAAVADVERCRAQVRVRDAALILYSSGTTSAPKGCVLSHEALVRTGAARIDERRTATPEVVWTPCPLFHVGALVPLIGCLATGSEFVTTSAFDAGRAIAQLEGRRVTTALPLFPAFTDTMCDHPSLAGADLTALRQILTTGVPAAVARAQTAFAPARLVSGYGMTELSGVMVASELEESDADRRVWEGRPFAGVEVRVVDAETGQPSAPGEVGEIVARGYCQFEGYLDDPEATAAAVDAEGFFHTGDIGVMDECGRLAFRGRFKDMLKVGGENVGSIEVEKVVGRCEGVRHVEVVGVPDARLGEVVGAFVELDVGATLTADDIVERCRDEIARFKVPRFVWFVRADEWPRSATKVSKVELRARAAAAVLEHLV